MKGDVEHGPAGGSRCRERCQGVMPPPLGASPLSPWDPDVAFRGEDGRPGILRYPPQTVREERGRPIGPLSLLLKSPS